MPANPDPTTGESLAFANRRSSRSVAGIKGADRDADFAEVQRLGPERAAKILAKEVGRMLTLPQV
jgi:hypothetical protein